MSARRMSRFRILAVLISALAAVGIGVATRAAPIEDDGLVPYEIVDGRIPEPLGGLEGDVQRGREIAAGREGNCLACHHMPIPEQQFHGDVGPDLHGVGGRLDEGELRLRLVDPKQIGPESIMPAFYVVDRLRRVAKPYRGQPILSAQQIEDVVAYLRTLRDE